MKKSIAVVLLSCAAFSTPVLAANTPVYVGLQVSDEYIGILGGFQLDPMYSVEVSYLEFDQISVSGGATSTKADASSLGVAGVAMFPMKLQGMPPFSFFAKAGFERVTVKEKTTNPFGSISTTATDTNLVLGGGAQYDFNSNVSARLGLDIAGEADTLYLSAIFKF